MQKHPSSSSIVVMAPANQHASANFCSASWAELPANPLLPTLCVQGIVLCFGNLFAPRRITSSVFLYALLTILFTVAGLAYLLLPK